MSFAGGNAGDHRLGLAMAFAGVSVLTPDSLFIRLSAADPWTLAFWRGLLMGGTILLVLAALYRGRLWGVIRQSGLPGLFAAACYACAAFCFVVAINTTTIANVMVTIASMPMFAALFSIILLREKTPLGTWVAIALVFAGIGLAAGFSPGTDALKGTLFALGAAGGSAAMLTTARLRPKLNMTPAVMLGGLLLALVAFFPARPLDIAPGNAVWVALQGLLVQPLAFGLFILSMRRVSSVETSLISRLESVLAPLLAWAVLAEQPSMQTLIGGAVVIITLLAHSLWLLRRGG